MPDRFGLRPEDEEYLDANYPDNWTLVRPDPPRAMVGLYIKTFRLPKGYCSTATTLMLIIPNGYPGAQLDMFYFSPSLERINGTAIPNVVTESHFAQDWQRWSRHYLWTPGVDSIVSHIEFVKNSLTHEVPT